MIIAIDGPAGSGKSTVAKAVAQRLGFRYLDTGAMYRAVAWRALEAGVALDDDEAVGAIARGERIEFSHAPGDALPSRVSIDGIDVTSEIRTPEADRAVSPVSALPSVRAAMVAQQREIACEADTVVEGRDIGTVVFPDAALKVYLTASSGERARRRAIQNARAGLAAEEAAVHDAIKRRDALDSTRQHSPLCRAPDAVAIDTTSMTFAEVVDEVARLAASRR